MSSSSSHWSHDSTSTENTSVELGPLQVKDSHTGLEPIEPDDPVSYDLVAPPNEKCGELTLEERADLLFSDDHLRMIFSDPSLFLKFTAFLSNRRPASVPILIYYLDALKAIKAVAYANSIVAESLEPLSGHSFTESLPAAVGCTDLEDKAARAFAVMVQEDLPAFITQVYINVVTESISRRVTGTLPPSLRDASEGLAEVFCLTDPSRLDNPIVFASQEFHRMTQYGVSYALGRNCRFLQGEKTSLFGIARLREACQNGKEHCELLLNYRRDGSTFMNLLMTAPLYDSRGRLRYFMGAQVDVSGLVQDCTDLESFGRLIDRKRRQASEEEHPAKAAKKDEFQDLVEMLNSTELDTVRHWGGRMHGDIPEQDYPSSPASTNFSRPRRFLRGASPSAGSDGIENMPATPVTTISSPPLSPTYMPISGKLAGVYQNYLLVRPYPSLRILFASPSLRVPGILQSPFLSRIGGSERVRTELVTALEQGRGVTAKIRWLTRFDEENGGRRRWLHCTPLLGANGRVGVWMVVIVDDESPQPPTSIRGRKVRRAPPVPLNLMASAQSKNDGAEGWPHSSGALGSTRSKSMDKWHAAAESVERRTRLPSRKGSLERMREEFVKNRMVALETQSLKSPAHSGFNLSLH